MIIWRLCDHPNYILFAEERIVLLENELKTVKNPEYSAVLEKIVDLKDRLENITPQFEWDNSDRTFKLYKGNTPVFQL